MAVKVSALRSGRPLPPGRFLVLISVRGWVDIRAVVRLEELGQSKNLMTSSGIESATSQLIAQYLNQLRYRIPLVKKREVKRKVMPATSHGGPQGCEIGSYIFLIIGSQTAARLSALSTSQLAGRYVVLISVRDWVDPGTLVRLEVLGQLKNLEWNPWPSGL
jgi:hypothetical protein